MEKIQRKGLLGVSGAIPCSQEGQCSKINQIAHGWIQQCLISPSLEIPHLPGPISPYLPSKFPDTSLSSAVTRDVLHCDPAALVVGADLSTHLQSPWVTEEKKVSCLGCFLL